VPSKSNPLSKAELAVYESKRDLAAELLQSVRRVVEARNRLGQRRPIVARQHARERTEGKSRGVCVVGRLDRELRLAVDELIAAPDLAGIVLEPRTPRARRQQRRRRDGPDSASNVRGHKQHVRHDQPWSREDLRIEALKEDPLRATAYDVGRVDVTGGQRHADGTLAHEGCSRGCRRQGHSRAG